MAFNQVMESQPLWRCEGDLWFWSANQQTAVKAWTAVEHFASVTAIPTNEDKSASVFITCDKETDSPMDDEVLPQGEI